MNNINLKNTAEQLIDTFIEAGRIAQKISDQGVKITIKEDKSPVTDGDLAVDKIRQWLPNARQKDRDGDIYLNL